VGLRIKWDDLMLNKTTLPDDSVSSFMEMMVWLSAQYGPLKKPAVPKILKPETPLHDRRWGEDDPRTVFTWAEAESQHIAQICHMEEWPVQVTPNGEKAKLHSISWTPMAMLNAYAPHDEELPYLYGTLIGLAAHRLTREQILATYGPVISNRTRKQVGTVLDQIASQKDTLKLLRLFTKPTHTEHLERSRLDPVQSSSGLG